jgi:hypothetical protein
LTGDGGNNTVSRSFFTLPFPRSFSAHGFQHSEQMSYSLSSTSIAKHSLAWPHRSQTIMTFLQWKWGSFDSGTLKHHPRTESGLPLVRPLEYQRMGVIIEEMLNIDVDEITEVNYLDGATPGETSGVAVTFKNGTTEVYEGAELPEALAILNHWTPPTA